MPRDLRDMPDWPAAMTRETAVLYLDGKKELLQRLEDGGYLSRAEDAHRRVTYLRRDIDLALDLFKANNHEPQPASV